MRGIVGHPTSALPRLLADAVVLIALACSVGTFASVDAQSHSVSDTLEGWVGPAVLIWLAAGAVLAGIASWSRSSRA